MSRLVLDTDAVSTLLRRPDDPRVLRHAAEHHVAITFVTVAELTKWTVVRHWGPDRRRQLQQFLASMTVLPYHRTIAERWGRLQGDAHLRGRPRPANDTWIAACCTSHDLPLLTFNTKDFADFAEYDSLRLVG